MTKREQAAMRQLLLAAYDRFTDNDFVPANHALETWKRETVALLLAERRVRGWRSEGF